MKQATSCLRAGYSPKNGEPATPPIVQSTTYVFDNTEHIAELFDMPTAHIYSRFSNPTTDVIEKKIAALEGAAAAMCTSSGQAASLLSILNICKSGESFISASAIYGGTINLFAVTLKRFGIECIFVDANSDEETLQKAFKPNTRLVFGESLSNPSLCVLDIEKFARVAHKNNVPLIIDNTFPTPILCRPIEYGADIVIHSTSKYLDGHAVQVGGIIVDSGNFPWDNGNFPDFCEPDASYHGVVYTRDFGNIAYIIKARMQLMRDFGCYPAAHSSFLLNLGIETLDVRMQRYCENTQKVVDMLLCSDKIVTVNYPTIKSNRYYLLAQKYLSNGCSGVLSAEIKGGRDAAARFADALQLVNREVHVADIRSCILHPASSSHRQLTDEQLTAAGINAGLIRLSVGLEDADDIIADLKQALDKV